MQAQPLVFAKHPWHLGDTQPQDKSPGYSQPVFVLMQCVAKPIQGDKCG